MAIGSANPAFSCFQQNDKYLVIQEKEQSRLCRTNLSHGVIISSVGIQFLLY